MKYTTTCIAFVLVASLAFAQQKKDSASVAGIFAKEHIGFSFTSSSTMNVGERVTPEMVDYSAFWYPTSVYYKNTNETPGFSFSFGPEWESKYFKGTKMFLLLGVKFGQLFYRGNTTVFDTEYIYTSPTTYTKAPNSLGQKAYSYQATYIGLPAIWNVALIHTHKARFYLFAGGHVLVLFSQKADPSYNKPDVYAGFMNVFCTAGIGYEHSIGNNLLLKIAPELDIIPDKTIKGRRLASAGVDLAVFFGK